MVKLIQNFDEAEAYLTEWLRIMGHKGEVAFFKTEQIPTHEGLTWEFEAVKPYGLFVVRQDGRIEDCYQIFHVTTYYSGDGSPFPD